MVDVKIALMAILLIYVIVPILGCSPWTQYPIKCQTHSQCPEILPFCKLKSNGSADDGQCEECGNDSHCSHLSQRWGKRPEEPKPFCNTDANVCRQCGYDSQCPEDSPFCDVVDHFCKGCEDDVQCGSEKPLCLQGSCHKAVEFTKIEGKYCVDRYEYFEELQSAKKHCQVSGLCQGVWDEYCDDNGPFRLCYVGYEYEDNSQGDCVYNKTVQTNNESSTEASSKKYHN